jgi:hypothetical protein
MEAALWFLILEALPAFFVHLLFFLRAKSSRCCIQAGNRMLQRREARKSCVMHDGHTIMQSHSFSNKISDSMHAIS